MKRQRTSPTSGADGLDLVNDILNRATKPPPAQRETRVGDMTFRKKSKTITSPSPSPSLSPSPSSVISSSSTNVASARRLLDEQLRTGHRVLSSMNVQSIPETEQKTPKTRTRKETSYVRSKVSGIDIEEVEEVGDSNEKKPNASYYKYKLPLRPCARGYTAQMTMSGSEDHEPESPIDKLEEKERCFVCNWSNFAGSGPYANKIGEFFRVYKAAKKTPNFAVMCNALAEWYMKTIYTEDNGMYPMTGRMFFNCMRGGHVETYEVWLRNEIEMIKSLNDELRMNMFMSNNAVHPDNIRARTTNAKLIDHLYGRLHKLLKEEDSGGSAPHGISGAPFSFVGIQTKDAQSLRRQTSARQSKISNMPNPF